MKGNEMIVRATMSSILFLAICGAVLTAGAGEARASTCTQSVQGEIGWRGSASWPQEKLDLLCRGAADSREPGDCFKRVITGGIDWGGGTSWNPDNALSLCAGTANADATISCFQDRIAAGKNWQTAINECSGGKATPTVALSPKILGKITGSSGQEKAAPENPTVSTDRMRVGSEAASAEPTGPVVPSQFHGQRNLGQLYLIERRFSITISDCLANLRKVEPGHMWRCDRSFDMPTSSMQFEPDAVFRLVYSDMESDCRVTVKPGYDGIGAQLTHAAAMSGGGPTISRESAISCMRKAFAEKGIDDRIFTIRLMTTNPE